MDDGNHGLDKEALSEVCWRDDVFLSTVPLTGHTVLEYFRGSPFYDNQSNNEMIRLQELDPALLNTMPGVAYVVKRFAPPALFCVQKQRKNSSDPKEVPTPMDCYYILYGTVYPCPDLQRLLSVRSLQSLYHIQRSFDALKKICVGDEYQESEKVKQKNTVSALDRARALEERAVAFTEAMDK